MRINRRRLLRPVLLLAPQRRIRKSDEARTKPTGAMAATALAAQARWEQMASLHQRLQASLLLLLLPAQWNPELLQQAKQNAANPSNARAHISRASLLQNTSPSRRSLSDCAR
jgi:hypothetical protein